VTCVHCGDTGSVRVYSHEDYGVSFESEYCESCDYGRSLITADLCSHEGHQWGDAGGGLLICLRCEAEKWGDGFDADIGPRDPDPFELDVFEGRVDYYGALS
jgi:hypothetical protein